MEGYKTQSINTKQHSILSGMVITQGEVVQLKIFSHRLQYASKIISLTPESMFSFSQTNNKTMLLSFFSGTITVFQMNNWSEKDIQFWSVILNKHFIEKVDCINDIFTPIKKLIDFTTSTSSYFLSKKIKDGLEVIIKATPLKIIEENQNLYETLSKQITHLRESKYQNMRLIGVYKSMNSIYIAYQTDSRKRISLESPNPEKL